MIPKRIFYYEHIIVEHQLNNCSSHATIVEFAFNFIGHHQHLYSNNNNNNNNNNNFANL